MIQANCRAQFTADDLQFLVGVLARRSTDRVSLAKLVSDTDTLDALLDDPVVFEAVLNRGDCLPISPHLYLYVLARRVLSQAGIADRAVADYVAELLTEFSEASRLHRLPSRPDQPFEYISDLLAVVSEGRREETFVVRAHIGNYTLFLTGVFREHLEHRARRRGAPALGFYEGIGSESYRLVSDHALARRRQLHEVFACLGEQFHAVRLALNDLADRLVHLEG
jgi:hypothetical protein